MDYKIIIYSCIFLVIGFLISFGLIYRTNIIPYSLNRLKEPSTQRAIHVIVMTTFGIWTNSVDVNQGLILIASQVYHILAKDGV